MRFLLLNQCFYPDVVSTAQHLTDLAKELAARGHEVTVLTSDRGYDDPKNRFARSESWNGVTIHRIPSLSLGKETKLKRALNFASFLLVCSLTLLTLKRFDVVVALTSPPLISFLAALFVSLKGGRFCFWVMDLNPDEAIAAGWLREDSLTSQLLQRMLNFSLKRADRTIVLDRFMKARVLQKGANPDHVSVLPPWSHDDAIVYSSKGREAFRAAHNLSEKFVVMYSGNHSPCHPLDTLLEAAQSLSKRPEFAFCFVGGGSEQLKVREFAHQNALNNVICLPYQPLSGLSSSLSAADLHVVVMGENFVGIVHPCKIYNVMAIGVPALYIGPEQSHIADLRSDVDSTRLMLTRNKDTAAVVQMILNSYQCRGDNSEMLSTPHSVRFSKDLLLPQMVKLIEFEVAESPLQQEAIQTAIKAQSS